MKYNQLRAMLAITKASFRSMTRSPSAIVFTLLFPLIFIVVFGFIGGGGIHIDIAVSKECHRNNPVYYNAHFIQSIGLIENMPDNEQLSALQKGKIDAILTITKVNKDTIQNLLVTLQTSQASMEKGIIAKSMMEHLVDKTNIAALGIKQPMAELRQTTIKGREYKTIDFILPGQLGFSLLSSGVFGTAFVFFNLRQTLVIKRFFATPIRKPFIVVGEAISRLTFSLLGSVFLLAIGHFAFGFTLIHGLSTALIMILLAALGLIVFMGFGFVVSGIAKSESTIPPLANIVTLPQFLLSGTFFSIEAFPTWLQPLCKVLPLTYLNDAMRKVAFEGASIIDISHEVGIITIWGIVVYALAVKFFRWE